MISRATKIKMRSLAAAMSIAPEPEMRASTWYSGPSICSRTRKSLATAEATSKMQDTSTKKTTEKPSTATESAIVVKGPRACTSCQMTSEATSAATETTPVPSE